MTDIAWLMPKTVCKHYWTDADPGARSTLAKPADHNCALPTGHAGHHVCGASVICGGELPPSEALEEM